MTDKPRRYLERPHLDEWGCIKNEDVRRGDRVTVPYGIITVREVIQQDSGYTIIIPLEDQPAVGGKFVFTRKWHGMVDLNAVGS